MRRIPGILLLLAFLGLGTGLLENLHLREHDHQQASSQSPAHSDSDCDLCLQLHLPAISAGWAPLLISLGLIVRFLTLLAPRLAPQRVAIRISCRGPPRL